MKKYLSIVVMLIVPLFIGTCYFHARAEARKALYLSDLRVAQSAGIALTDYVSSHKGRFPDTKHWEESIKPYWPDGSFTVLFKVHPGDRLVMNRILSGKKLNQIDHETVLLYEDHSAAKDASGDFPWKHYAQCGSSTKEWRMLVFSSGWASSYVEGPEVRFAPQNTQRKTHL